MPRSLATLPTEIICEVIKVLPLDDAQNFLLCTKAVHELGKHAFNQRCFRVLPVRLSHGGLKMAEKLVVMESSHFIQKIFIKIEAFRDPNIGADKERLEFILRSAFQASTKINTVTINYDPDYYDPELSMYRLYTEVLAGALSATLERQRTNDLSIQIQNIRLDDCRTISSRGRCFLDRVSSLGLRIEEGDRTKSFESLISLGRNLTEFSVINNAPNFLTTSAIRKFMEKINIQKLESLTLFGISVSIDRLIEVLNPLKASLKKLQLQ